jgi:hypothetical protein
LIHLLNYKNGVAIIMGSSPEITCQTIQNDNKCVKKIKISPQESGRPNKRRSEAEMLQIVKEIFKTPNQEFE